LRNVLLVVATLSIALIAAILVDRSVMRPRREARVLIDAARPHASSSNEADWLRAEALLARAELLHRHEEIGRLRAQIAAQRATSNQRDEAIRAAAFDACLHALEKAGHGAEATKLRSEVGSKRELHVRCMQVQLQFLSVAPSASASP
jgi:hypothetical protein